MGLTEEKADHLAPEATPPHGAVCPRCEESSRLAVFEEYRRPVVRSAGRVRLLAAAALGAYGWGLLLQGHTGFGASLLAGALAAGALIARALTRAGSGWRTQVLYCPRCRVRFRPGDPVTALTMPSSFSAPW
ncbi:hypothetical protein [Kitasatospora sp. NPDC087315]|uniref:hypothetical protein n=1 Tax=Kitasatospora sp. NPDC087315 TaxID=3364069 RepID=UPI00380FAB1D